MLKYLFKHTMPFLVAILPSLSSFATDSKDWLTIMSENDIIAGDDGGYTNGFAVSWGHGPFESFEGNIPSWMSWLSDDLWISTADNKSRAVSYLIAQQMFTPADINIETIIPDDRPYAGVLAWQASLHAFDDQVSDRLNLLLGLVGPDSGAEDMQTLVHRITGSDKPKGWDGQLDNEAFIGLQLSRLWRLHNGTLNDIEYDFIGTTSASVSNFKSNIDLGIGFRIGSNLARSFAFSSSIPGRDINPLAGSKEQDWYLFFNLLSQYIVNDMTLDGNNTSHSHSVQLEKHQATAVFGVAFNYNHWGFVISTARGSDQFKTQRENTEFGSMSLTYQY